MHQAIATKPNILNSWKEIACYLDRSVRTVQRWEAELHIPVHRIGCSHRSPVFAFKAELDNWMRKQAGAERSSVAADGDAEKLHHSTTASTLDRSARLTSEALVLLQKQQVQTKLLAELVKRMAHLLPLLSKFRVRTNAQHTAA